MKKQPLQVLQGVLDAGQPDVEHTLSASPVFDDVNSLEFEDALAEYVQKYKDLVGQVSAGWGPPSFNDGMGNSKFPKWYEAEFLACWPKGDRTAYVALRHDDKELPLLLVYGVIAAKSPASSTGGKTGKLLETVVGGHVRPGRCCGAQASEKRPVDVSVR